MSALHFRVYFSFSSIHRLTQIKPRLWADLGETAHAVQAGDVYTAFDSLMFFDRDPENQSGIRKEECYHSFRLVIILIATSYVVS